MAIRRSMLGLIAMLACEMAIRRSMLGLIAIRANWRSGAACWG